MPVPKICCQKRLTATRAVSGFLGSTSHRANPSRFRGASGGNGGKNANGGFTGRVRGITLPTGFSLEELDKREKAVETLVKPICDSLKQVDEHVRELEKSRAEAYGGLKTQVESLLETQKALQAETGNLVKALREPQARGRWGELQLRRCLELAGMLTSDWRTSESNRRAKFYKLTAAGRKHLAAQSTNWNRLVLAIARVMEG